MSEHVKDAARYWGETALPKPLCAICHKTVDSMRIIQDFRTNSYMAVAECHGARELCSVPLEVIKDYGKLDAGTAFEEKKLLTKEETE